MYTMPLSTYPNGTQRVFFEETSLVGEGARRLTFEECKRRMYKRLEYLGMSVLGVEEEEYCYIPMGGAYLCILISRHDNLD
jgi:lycopene beta-cyclase